ncbi:MAG: spore coat protein, partial [Spirochaetaceae bacterium]|nr:spore coat protein [Spirochaetaceae bacterium]
MSSTALFLQCRLDSSRLPGKALINIEGKTVIELAMEALKPLNVEHHI